MPEPFTLEADELVQKETIGPDDLIVYTMGEIYTSRRLREIQKYLSDLTTLYQCEAMILANGEKLEVFRKEPVDHL